ncbi:MAG: hypothetical protein L6R39_005498 [Caloplaca ligustica]|nr:MAG: hypothetical protein L6R39_005498 [Caloplaca ligustica]
MGRLHLHVCCTIIGVYQLGFGVHQWDISYTSLESLMSKYELNLLFITTSALNLLGDIYLLLIPLAAVAKLQMPLRQKLGVSAVFLAGVLACAAAAFATYYRILLLHTRDITWNFTPIFILSVTEINTGIIVSCMPTMPALIHDIRSDVSVSRKPSQTCSSRVGGESRSQSRSQHHHHPSKASAASKSCIHTANSSRDTQRQVRFDIPRGQSPVELDSTPVQMEEALMRTTPRSHFSDDSSVRGSVVHQPGEYGWLT